MTEVVQFDPAIPAQAKACLSNITGVQRINGFINCLSGGSGAQLWEVRLTLDGESHDRIRILKFGDADAISQEAQHNRDASASTDSPPMATIEIEGPVVDGWQALVFSVAQGSTWGTQKLADCLKEYRGRKALQQLGGHLGRWYSHQQPLVRGAFDFILSAPNPLRSINSDHLKNAASRLGIGIDEGQILFQGEEKTETMPNPLRLVLHRDTFTARNFAAPFGAVHGDS